MALLGNEIDKLVAGNVSDCEKCKHFNLSIGRDWTDLNQAVKQASRPNAHPQRIQKAKEAKERLNSSRTEALRHIETDH